MCPDCGAPIEPIPVPPGGKIYFDTEFTKGNTMQFWVSFDDEKSLHRAYDVLKEKAEIHWPLSQGDWCKMVADLTDKYGVRRLLSY